MLYVNLKFFEIPYNLKIFFWGEGGVSYIKDFSLFFYLIPSLIPSSKVPAVLSLGTSVAGFASDSSSLLFVVLSQWHQEVQDHSGRSETYFFRAL